MALALHNSEGGTPAGLTLLQMGAYCANTVAVGGGAGFGYSLSSCRDAVLNSTANPKCSGKIFDFNRGYNGQCKCATDDCLHTHHQGGYNIYRVSPGAPAVGVDIAVNLTSVGLVRAPGDEYVEVFDIWERRVVGSVHLSQVRNLRAINPDHSMSPSHSLTHCLRQYGLRRMFRCMEPRFCV